MPNQSSSLSKNDLTEVLDFITACTFQKSFEEADNLFDRLSSLVPTDGIAAVVGHTDESGEVKRSHIVNISYPERWIAMYEERNYLAVDPIVQRHFSNFMIQKWSDASSIVQSNAAYGFWEEARRFNLDRGLTVGLPDTKNMRASLFSFAGRHLEQEVRHLQVMNYILPHLHEAFLRSSFGRAQASVLLTERELEVLKWVKEGKTNWEISCILAVSERTVKFHLQNVSSKLGAHGRTHIVAVALSRGIIEL